MIRLYTGYYYLSLQMAELRPVKSLNQTVESIFSQIQFLDGSHLTSEEVSSFVGITKSNGSPLLTIKNPALISEILSFLYQNTFDQVYEYLEETKDRSSHTIILNMPGFDSARRKFKSDIDALSYEPEIAESESVQCTKCNEWKTSFVMKQTRSGDEQMTAFISCKNCGNRWVK